MPDAMHHREWCNLKGPENLVKEKRPRSFVNETRKTVHIKCIFVLGSRTMCAFYFLSVSHPFGWWKPLHWVTQDARPHQARNLRYARECRLRDPHSEKPSLRHKNTCIYIQPILLLKARNMSGEIYRQAQISSIEFGAALTAPHDDFMCAL